jgi:hypothetical protein
MFLRFDGKDLECLGDGLVLNHLSQIHCRVACHIDGDLFWFDASLAFYLVPLILICFFYASESGLASEGLVPLVVQSFG